MRVYAWRCSACGSTALLEEEKHERFKEIDPEELSCSAINMTPRGPGPCSGTYEPFVQFAAEPLL